MSKTTKPKYTLYYFPVRGRAELTRLIFTEAGVPFEDKRITGEEWLKYKPKTPAGQMPVLEVDGKMLPQSMSIVRYISREFGLHGKTNWESAQVDVILDTCSDLAQEGVKMFFEKDEAKKKEMQDKMMTETVPKFITIFEKYMADFGKEGFMVGNKLTTADLAVYNLLTQFNKIQDHSAKLKAHFEMVGKRKNIKEYVAKRPQTEL